MVHPDIPPAILCPAKNASCNDRFRQIYQPASESAHHFCAMHVLTVRYSQYINSNAFSAIFYKRIK